MFHQVELKQLPGEQRKVYWLNVTQELVPGDVVIVNEEDGTPWRVDRAFVSLSNLDSLPVKARMGSVREVLPKQLRFIRST